MEKSLIRTLTRQFLSCWLRTFTKLNNFGARRRVTRQWMASRSQQVSSKYESRPSPSSTLIQPELPSIQIYSISWVSFQVNSPQFSCIDFTLESLIPLSPYLNFPPTSSYYQTTLEDIQYIRQRIEG